MPDDDWDDYESGPFCRHWAEPGDCDIVCATCSHGCWRHYGDSVGKCDEDGCACKEWAEPQSKVGG